jgi:hypothetical protein
MRAGTDVPFTFITGGVKYRAVFQHKEARYVFFCLKDFQY